MRVAKVDICTASLLLRLVCHTLVGCFLIHSPATTTRQRYYPTTSGSEDNVHHRIVVDRLLATRDASMVSCESIKPANFVSTSSASLAGSFLIRCTNRTTNTNSIEWNLMPLSDVEGINTAMYPTEAAQAWAALHETAPSSSELFPLAIQATLTTPQLLKISTSTSPSSSSYSPWQNDSDSVGLLPVLSRIFLQWVLNQWKRSSAVTIYFADEEMHIDLDDADVAMLSTAGRTYDESDTLIRRLYEGVTSATDSSEIVEMVDQSGVALGVAPRKLVHRYNVLHRGIGLFVSKDRPISSLPNYNNQQPDLYCHRRASTKRIFPSMYDMFVGGVSLAGEDATVTARREVAEELGLTEAVKGLGTSATGQVVLSPCPQLSERILRCVVCTGYNRCVVDLFCYTMDTKVESISWQAEEVEWGSFVPYNIIQAAAEQSIGRLASTTQGWPGRYPPKSANPEGGMVAGDFALDLADDEKSDWTSWDFVPDGLLVWDAWLRLIQSQDHRYVEER